MGIVVKFIAMKDLPNRIRALRKAKGWTLQELAARVGISIGHLSEIETGKRQLTQRYMVVFAREFGCAPSDILPFSQNTGALTPDEAALLMAYRMAAPTQKEAIARVADSLSGYSAEPAILKQVS